MIINVVFSGGGIKGLAYIGALRFLEEQGIKITKAAGTSVGALFSALVIAGFNAKELAGYIDDFNIETLISYGGGTKAFKKFFDVITKKGIYSIHTLEEFLADILSKKNVYTFKDVKENNDYKLKMMVTEIKTARNVIIPDELPLYNIDPDNFPVARAVVMSCNVPLFYQPYVIGKYAFVDGGIGANYPLWIFDNEKNPTYGFRLTKQNQEQQELLQAISKYGKNIINRIFLSPHEAIDDPRTINIVIPDIKMLEFKKGFENCKKLYFMGYQATKDYFIKNGLIKT